MKTIRIAVEWPFGDLMRKFPFLAQKSKQRQLLCPVAAHCRAGVLLYNCIATMYPSQVAQYFSCPPPQLETYLANARA